MIPYILAAVGGYLIGDSLKGKQFADGGMMANGGKTKYGNKKIKYKGFEIIQHDSHCEIKGYSWMMGTFFQSGDIETIEQAKEVIDLALNKKNIPNIKDIHKRIVHYSDNRYNKNLTQYADGGMMAKGGKTESQAIPIEKIKKLLEGMWNSYHSGIMAGKKDDGYVSIRNEEDLMVYLTQKLGNVVKNISVLELGKNYPYNRSNPYFYDTYLVELIDGNKFEIERLHGRPNYVGNVSYTEGITVNQIK